MDRSYHIGIAARAQHAVHLGQLLPDAVGIPLAEAAGHQQLFQFALPLQLSQLQDMVNGLALGRLNEAAGVEHRHVRPLRLSGDGKAGVPAQSHHLFCIHQVFGAAKGHKGHFVRHCVHSNFYVMRERQRRIRHFSLRRPPVRPDHLKGKMAGVQLQSECRPRF